MPPPCDVMHTVILLVHTLVSLQAHYKGWMVEFHIVNTERVRLL